MTPLFIFSTILGICLCGITLDLGMIERTRLQMQNAADAAALGAQVSHDQEDANWQTNALLDAGQNGFANGVNNVTVTVVEQPASGTYAGNYDAFQVTITKKLNTMFMGIVNVLFKGANTGATTIAVQAVSLTTPCVYLTGAHSPQATYPLMLTVGSTIGYAGGSTMGCPANVARGAYVDGDSSLWMNATNVTGTPSQSAISGGLFHAPHYSDTYIANTASNATSLSLADPLVYTAACATLSANCVNGTSYGIAAPAFSSCTYTNKTWPSGTAATLSPGTYCGSFNFTNATIALSPGLYIVTGGASWTNSTIAGSGVTLYFTQKGDGNYGKFIATNTAMTLSAPAASVNHAIPAILFMNDPNWVPSSPQDFQLLSGTRNTGDGIYYLVNTGLSISSSTLSAPHYLCFDVDNLLLVSSGVTPMANFSTVPTGNPFTPKGSLVQ